ncbi:hypothetical protein [Clostridium luticellarii]|jgi:hypothetical protein|nr:hypothetical protein [Clostridium luticellarii]
MPKDSQPDSKGARIKKCRGNTSITEEAKNHNKNRKKHSAK